MLLASSGIAFSTHFCGGIAVENGFSLGYKALDCGMAVSSCSLTSPKNTSSVDQPDCCDTQINLLQIDQLFQTDFVKAERVDGSHFILAVCPTSPVVINNILWNLPDCHAPPESGTKRCISLQTFLI